MRHFGSSDRFSSRSVSHLVDRACSRWELQRQANAARQKAESGKPQQLTVAISRQAGAQGTAVATEVGRLLDWPVYDQELLKHVAQDMGVQEQLLNSVDERHQSWILESAEAFLSAPGKDDWGPRVTESGFVHHLVKTILALGALGECVIVGRGAAFILPPATTLRVRLVAPLKHRIAVLRDRLGITEAEAIRKVRDIDHGRDQFVRSHFFKDPNDLQQYDLVLDTAELSIPQLGERIAHELTARRDGSKLHAVSESR